MLSLRFPWGPCVLCVAALSVAGCLLLTGGCPRPPTNPDNSGGQTDNNGTTDGSGTSDGTGGGTNSGDGTSGGTNGGSTGGDTSGGGTSGGDTSGGSSGGTGGDTSGGGSGGTGGDTNNGGTSNGGSTPTPAPTSYSLTAIARTGDAVPGQPSGVTFTTFGNPVIDAKGRVAFWGFYTGSGAKGTGGLYADDGTNLVKVIDNDPASAGVVPGRTGAYFQYDPNEPDIAWGAGDRLLFCAQVKTSSVTATGVYRWRASDANLVCVADRDQVAATFTDIIRNDPTQFQGTFLAPGVSDDGLASFGVHYTYIRDPNEFPGFEAFVMDKNAVFTSNGTTLTKIADDSSQRAGTVADYPADGYFSAVVPATSISGASDMLFQGTYVSGSSTWRGVYVGRGGVPYRVIDNRTGASWPGLPSGAQFLARSATLGYALSIGPAGHIVVAGRLAVGGNTDDAVILWEWDIQTWAELTGTGGSAATALLSGVNDAGQAVILSGGNPYLASGAAQTQFNATLPTALQGATLTWSDSGGAVNNNGRAAVQYTNNAKPGLALWTGAELLVVADGQAGNPPNLTEIHTVTGPEQDRPGRSGLLNDTDDLTFRGLHSDTTEAIYVALGQ